MSVVKTNSMVDLPLLVLCKIVGMLDYESRFMLSQTCRWMREVIVDSGYFSIKLISQDEIYLPDRVLATFLGLHPDDKCVDLDFRKGTLVCEAFFRKLSRLVPNLEELTLRRCTLAMSEHRWLYYAGPPEDHYPLVQLPRSLRALRLLGVAKASPPSNYDFSWEMEKHESLVREATALLRRPAGFRRLRHVQIRYPDDDDDDAGRALKTDFHAICAPIADMPKEVRFADDEQGGLTILAFAACHDHSVRLAEIFAAERGNPELLARRAAAVEMSVLEGNRVQTRVTLRPNA